MTHTRTHVIINFANPYLRCTTCAGWVTGWHNDDRCGPGCDAGAFNVPCEHTVGVISACPSWGPVDGCRCPQQAGRVRHEVERYCVTSGRPVHMIPGDRCLSHGAAPAPCVTAVGPAQCEHPRRSPNHPVPTCEECGKSIPPKEPL